MCRRHLFSVLLILTLGLASSASAQDWDIEIPSTPKPPTIDGQVDGIWSIAPVQYITITVNGSFDSPEDCSGSWQAMWDGENLYVIVDINDTELYNDSGSAYQDDSVEFYFDGGNSKGPGAPLADDDRQYTFGWTADDIQGTNQETARVEFAQVDTETGWRIEIQFPWTSLTDVSPAVDNLIGIDCFYNDDDDGGDTREAQISTFAGSGDDWQVPANWGTGILVRGSSENASAVYPKDQAVDVPREVVLEWTPGEFASTHDVYFGAVFEDVDTASRTDPRGVLLSQGQTDAIYELPSRLDFGVTYYWRIDEVNGAPDFDIHKGDLWSFTTEPFAYPIENIIATSNLTPTEGQGPENAVNGSGLNSDDQHSTTTSQMWGGEPPENETPQIQFEFDRVYELYEMHVWNHNFDFEQFIGVGLKDVTVEYSTDGVQWTSLGDVVLAQAPGLSTYVYNTTIEFDGVPAKYVRLMILSSYGTSGRMGLSEVRFMYLPAHAREPEPEDGATDVALNPVLSWRPGREAVSHEVYLGMDAQALAPINTTSQSTYSPATLDLDTAYYWRVNEVNQAEAIPLWEGSLWTFSTQEYIVVDDFESYIDNADIGDVIWEIWIDGWIEEGGDPENGGSVVGNSNSPFAEQAIVHSSAQSMPLFFENTSASAISEVDQIFVSAQNWTASRVQSLSLWFYGAVGNAGQLYVKINDFQVLYDGDPDDIARAQWRPWNIDLSTVGGDLSNVTVLSIGIQGMGEGVVYIDDIRLYPYAVETIVPVDPDPANLAAHYTFDEGAGTTVSDASGNGNHGTIAGNPAWVTGAVNGAMEFGGNEYVDCGNGDSLKIRDAITIACWVKIDSFTVDWETILAMGDDSYRMSRGPVTGDSIHFGCNGVTGGDLNATAPVTTGTWRHVALVFDGAYRYIYIDGAEDARLESTGQIDASAHNLYIGENSQETGRQLAGAIDDVRIYSRALSPAEVAGLVGRTALVHVPF